VLLATRSIPCGIDRASERELTVARARRTSHFLGGS
jgi:hypothetical protein